MSKLGKNPTPERIDYIEFKRKEYIGDAVASLVCRMVICSPNKDHIVNAYKAQQICSNYNFAETANRLGLKPHRLEGDANVQGIIYRSKPLANAYEVKLYEIFMEMGLEKTVEFFKQTAIANFEGK